MKFTDNRQFWKAHGGLVLPTNAFIEPVIERGAGTYVWDVAGKKYLDLNCGQFCLCFGHNYPPLIRAIARQAKKISHTNTNTMASAVFEALRKLVRITDNKFASGILLSTGAEAVEFALRFSKSAAGSEKVIFINQGYHGLSLGSQSVSTYGRWASPKVRGTFGFDVPLDAAKSAVAIAKIRRIVRENKGKVAAVIVEPVLGAGGMLFPPRSFFRDLRAVCTENGITLIFDECQTGFGRTGHWFCYQLYDVCPDVLVFAKAAGAGFPVSGVLFIKDLVEKIRAGTLTHFSSHQNDPLPAAVLSFVIDEIERKKILARVRKTGKYILDGLTAIAEKSRLLVNPRGAGLMIGFDLDKAQLALRNSRGQDLIAKLVAKGVIIQCINRGFTFRVMPNYLISLKDADSFLGKLERSLREIEHE